MNAPRSAIVLVAVGLVAVGCGGGSDSKSSVSPSKRIAACTDKQPDLTQSECEGFEKDGKLNDDGTHQDHENMG